jgi:hypothetical protein
LRVLRLRAFVVGIRTLVTQTTGSSDGAGDEGEPMSTGEFRAGHRQPRWLRQSLGRTGQPRAEFTVWADEQLRRNVIPAEHRAALVNELRHWLSVVPPTDRQR